MLACKEWVTKVSIRKVTGQASILRIRHSGEEVSKAYCVGSHGGENPGFQKHKLNRKMGSHFQMVLSRFPVHTPISSCKQFNFI